MLPLEIKTGQIDNKCSRLFLSQTVLQTQLDHIHNLFTPVLSRSL